MAITSITQPQSITPVYNDVFIVVDSTNKENEQFKYIFDVYINGDLLHTFKVFPEFGSLYGRQMLSKLLASYLTNTLRHLDNETLITGAETHKSGLNLSYINAVIKVGEESVSPAWSFDFVGWGGNTTSWANFDDPEINPNGLTRSILIGEDEPDYNANDVINVTQTDSDVAGLVGTHSVLDTFLIVGGFFDGKYAVVLSHVWVNNSSKVGDTFYSDGRKTMTRDILTTNNIVVFNGAKSFKEFKDWNANEYRIEVAVPQLQNKLMTDVPRTWRVRKDSVVLIQGFIKNESSQVTFNTLAGAEIDTYNLDTGLANDVIMMDFSPRIPLEEGPTITAYKASVFNVILGTKTLISEEITFKIDNRCYGYRDVEVLFMDRMGSIIPFQFHLKTDQNITVTRSNYKKDVASNLMYVYNLSDGGEEAINIEFERNYTLRTSAMSLEESLMLEQLVTSPYTLVKFGSGEYLRCEVVTNSLQIQDEDFDGLKFQDIQIKMSNKDVINW
jgi:hypothetical protein